MQDLAIFGPFGLNAVSDWAAARGLPFGYERSARFANSELSTQRGLLSFATRHNLAGEHEGILSNCQAMNAPVRFCESIRRFLPSAAFVHFGFEQASTALIGKCYLELPPAAADGGGPQQSGRLQFVGFKWSLTDASTAVVTRYRTVNCPGWEDIERRLADHNSGSLSEAALQLLRQVCRAVDREPTQQLTCLEIEEEGSQRRSIDINVYPWETPLSNVSTEVRQLASVVEVPDDVCRDWLQAHANSIVGHLAGGMDRREQPFLTLYHGMTEITPVSEADRR